LDLNNLQIQGDKLAWLAVNQLDPTPLWYCWQEINQQEVDHHKALQAEAVAVAVAVVAVAVVVAVAEKAVAQEWQQQQLWQRQSQHCHYKQVHFLGVMEQ
jgi:hypothetical protein